MKELRLFLWFYVFKVPATSTVKKSFCTISDLIVISDDDDDDSIVNSQIFHITESIKKEHSSQHENVFDDIKKELSDLDYCNKEIEVDLTDEFEVCQNTIDLLNILVSTVVFSRYSLPSRCRDGSEQLTTARSCHELLHLSIFSVTYRIYQWRSYNLSIMNLNKKYIKLPLFRNLPLTLTYHKLLKM